MFGGKHERMQNWLKEDLQEVGQGGLASQLT
jgi:hypothetical protein